MIASWVGQCKLHSAELCFLSSGHSHEDVDMMFSLVRAHLERNQELETPECFRRCIEGFFANTKNRPHEPSRFVTHVTQFRDWNLICKQHILSVHAFGKFQQISRTPCRHLGLVREGTQASCHYFREGAEMSYPEKMSAWKPVPSSLSRKNWLSSLYGHAHIFGIGGPGAPHAFRLRRFVDTGLTIRILSELDVKLGNTCRIQPG